MQKCVDSDQMLHSVASDLGPHCLPKWLMSVFHRYIKILVTLTLLVQRYGLRVAVGGCKWSEKILGEISGNLIFLCDKTLLDTGK